MVKALAYYLPQYHRIPENDAWWGEGFTEWVGVKKTRPQFEGHLQPRQPTELGYYDLSDPSVLMRQIELAKSHGVHGFCYYTYWFGGGKQLLEKPLEMMLADKDYDMPFCLFWANKSWTRAWSRQESAVLQAQTYPLDDAKSYAAYLARFFGDERYVRIGGAPVFIVYRSRDFFGDSPYLDALRAELAAVGFPNVFWMFSTIRRMHNRWGTKPFDLGTPLEFPSNVLVDRSVERTEGTRSEYRSIMNVALARGEGQKLYRSVMTGFDDTPRRPARGTVVVNSSPEAYSEWLDRACKLANSDFKGDARLVFIYAWNEWAEGGFLEPDLHFGRGFLEATRDVMAKWQGDD
jgi:O-antigen biosynthesis protein